MNSTKLTQLYCQDSLVQSLAQLLVKPTPQNVQLKGLAGSGDAFWLDAICQLKPHLTHVVVVNDKDRAHALMSDLQHSNENVEVLLFPASYKKIYQYDEIENANVLLRAEVLNKLNHTENNKGKVIITYSEALCEKVINKRSLLSNTLVAKVGDKIDIPFLMEILHQYEFELSDFVFEPGQFAIRGGIVDIFSFSNELPYRLELFGDEIDSIRTFHPDTQLSVETKNLIAIIPNIQTRLVQENREHFSVFLPKDTCFWFKDVKYQQEMVEKTFTKANEEFLKRKQIIGEAVTNVNDLFENWEELKSQFANYHIIEFGHKFSSKPSVEFEWNQSFQPSFNKDFNLINDEFTQYNERGYTCLVSSDSLQQLARIESIFTELNPQLRFERLSIPLCSGFVDHILKLVCYTDHQLFDRFHRVKTKERFGKKKSLTIKELTTLQQGDYIVHEDYGIGRFVGLEKVIINEQPQEAIRLLFRDDDLLKISILGLHKISKYSGKDGNAPVMSKLGSPEWENKKKTAKKKVKDIAQELISLYAKRKLAPGYAFSNDSFMQVEMETSFLYEDTPDQAKATQDVKIDMEKPHPMDRLVCGDVGFGKTEIAIRAAFKAVCDSKQAVVLVPTTVLAMQHFKTFRDRLEKFPCRVDYISRFRTQKQIKDILQNVADGKIDILIGTHRVVNKDVKFKDLGLLIIDEEQKFGVSIKEKLKEFKLNVDTLTLTATPIPRTLHFSLMGARDLSIINTPPPNRQPVTTEVHVFDKELIRDAVSAELKRGGQVFFIHNRVSDLLSLADTIYKLVPDARVGIAHGQMDGDLLETNMLKFVEGDFDVLVSTNIVESGLDIPNANTIIINNAHHFGLSDLHQMRGRVGRSNKKAFCYLLSGAVLSADSRKRLHTLEEFSDLGDGFKVAMRDLDIRGAGNLLGGEQTGFITDLGFEVYHKILDEAIAELKENEFKDLFMSINNTVDVKKLLPDCIIETDLAILIPDYYVTNISERIGLYAELDNIKNEEGLTKFQTSLIDRFGKMPFELIDLLETVRLRWDAEVLGFEKLVLKGKSMKAFINTANNEAYFQSDIFGKVVNYVQKHAKRSRLKEQKDKLTVIFDEVNNVKGAKRILEGLLG